MHEGTGGAPITRMSFGPITRENSRKAIRILGGLVRNRCRPLGHAHRTMGVQDPLCNAAATETSGTGDHIPQGLKWSSLNQSVQELRNKGAIEPAPLTPGFYSRLFLVHKATGEWRPIIDLSSLNVFVHCPSFTMETPRSILMQGPTIGPVVNLPRPERCLLSYRDRPSGQTLPTLLSQRHHLAIYSTAIRVVNQSESIYQNTQTCTSICPPPPGKIAHVHRRMVVKPRDTPGSSRANILAQVPVPCGFKPREIRLPRIWGSSWRPL